MYLSIYDSEPKRFQEILTNGNKGQSRYHQKGIREKLFCDECETKLSKVEKIADQVIYNKNNKGQAKLNSRNYNPIHNAYLNEFINIPYREFKLFLDSILFRLIVSSKYETPKYNSQITNTLKESLFNETALSSDKYPCTIQFILKDDNKPLRNFQLFSIDRNRNNPETLSIIIDGMVFTFYLEKNPKPEFYVKENGRMTMISFFLRDHQYFLEIFEESLKHFKK